MPSLEAFGGSDTALNTTMELFDSIKKFGAKVKGVLNVSASDVTGSIKKMADSLATYSGTYGKQVAVMKKRLNALDSSMKVSVSGKEVFLPDSKYTMFDSKQDINSMCRGFKAAGAVVSVWAKEYCEYILMVQTSMLEEKNLLGKNDDISDLQTKINTIRKRVNDGASFFQN